MSDFDSPWKEALQNYFQAFLALSYPKIHADIDWSRHFEFLDKELQKIVPKAAKGRQYVDKLVKVWRKNGKEAWVLIHIEVQTQADPEFAQRMFDYNMRIYLTYKRTVVSLAVLADDDANWRPDQYRDELWGWSVGMKWPPAKLLDYAKKISELEASDNPFAKVVLAHLKALETRDDPQSRRTWKVRLVRGLYERGFSGEDVRQLFRIIDWLMELPEQLDNEFAQEIDKYEEEQHMPYVTSVERVGVFRVIRSLLLEKFGADAADLVEPIRELNDAEKYEKMNRAIGTATTLAEVRRAYARLAAPPRKRNGKAKR